MRWQRIEHDLDPEHDQPKQTAVLRSPADKELIHKSWTIKTAERPRMDAFELWCWRSLLRVPWTARRSNQSVLKEISPEYSLEGLLLKLKLHAIHVQKLSN